MLFRKLALPPITKHDANEAGSGQIPREVAPYGYF